MSRLTAVIERVEKHSRAGYLLAMTAVVIILNLLLSSLAGISGQETGEHHVIYYWWLTILLFPILETFFFQASMNWIMELFDARPSTITVISGLLFGLAHFRGPETLIYVFSATIAGIIFSWMYLHRLHERSFLQAFGDVCFVHSANNAVFFALMYHPL